MWFRRFKDKIYSGNNIVNFSEMRYLPRWLVLFIDIVILWVSMILSYYILMRLNIWKANQISTWNTFVFVTLVNGAFMFLFKTYAGIIRHSTFVDLLKIFFSSICTFTVLVILNSVFRLTAGYSCLNFSFLTIYFTISVVGLFLFRLIVKEIFHFAREFRRSTLKKRILILGIDEQSISIARAILDNPQLPYSVVGFLTERRDSSMAKLLGKPILSRKKIEEYDEKTEDIDGVLINRNQLTKEEMTDWVNMFLSKNLQVFKAPTVQKVRGDEHQINIYNLQIEDLLNRKPIVIENQEVTKRHFQKNILVTGGAGSIGSELVKQIAQFNPSLIVVLDQAETPLYDIELEMRHCFPNIRFKFVLADITQKDRMEQLFQKYQFSMVYHAAAYKHVPLIEQNPHEAARVNIQGTKNIALLSSKYGVNRFVMVSTDKAVNPTNVMGASKRTAELFVQALQTEKGHTTKFITTRFGNVLGSNGSVIPYFKKQIAKGGPVTITHPDIVRYFMTIPEACELVLQAGTMGKGGEIFVFDMGEPVKILHLAKKMIKLSGFEPDVDIKIVFTGLRPGEKLYEELLSDNTKTLPTHHEKIMISKDEPMAFEQINSLTEKIYEQTQSCSPLEIVKTLKEIVKEYRSNNSVYEQLDK